MDSRSDYILTSVLPQIEIILEKIFDLEVDLLSLEHKLAQAEITFRRKANEFIDKSNDSGMN